MPPNPVVLLEGTGAMAFHGTSTVADGKTLHVRADLSILGDEIWVSRNAVRMTVIGDDYAVDIQGCLVS